MKRNQWIGLGLLSLLVTLGSVAACLSPGGGQSEREKEVLRRDVLAWLECEECTEGELDAVLKEGNNAVPTLAAVLAGGPSPANRERLRRHLEETWDELQTYARTHPEARIDLGREDYVALYMDNYVALYQSRAAHALRQIGTSAAKEALASFDPTGARPDVQRVLREGLAR